MKTPPFLGYQVQLKNNLFEVKGEIAYSKKISAATYSSGIKFTGVNERVTTFITNLIKEYNYQGYNLSIRWRDREPAPILHEST